MLQTIFPWVIHISLTNTLNFYHVLFEPTSGYNADRRSIDGLLDRYISTVVCIYYTRIYTLFLSICITAYFRKFILKPTTFLLRRSKKFICLEKKEEWFEIPQFFFFCYCFYKFFIMFTNIFKIIYLCLFVLQFNLNAFQLMFPFYDIRYNIITYDIKVFTIYWLVLSVN